TQVDGRGAPGPTERPHGEEHHWHQCDRCRAPECGAPPRPTAVTPACRRGRGTLGSAAHEDPGRRKHCARIEVATPRRTHPPTPCAPNASDQKPSRRVGSATN